MTEQVWLGVLGLVGSALTLIGVIVTFFLQERRMKRQREWDLADIAAARKRSEERASEVTGTVLKAIDANTLLTEQAVETAADVNAKIEAVGAVRRTDMNKRSTDG